MSKKIRIIVECYDEITGDIIDNKIISGTSIKRAERLEDLRYNHVEQIELQRIQDICLGHQILLNSITVCPVCGCHTRKDGKYMSTTHTVFTDHQVILQRTACRCGWRGSISIEKLFGSKVHPDLLKNNHIKEVKKVMLNLANH